MLRTMVPAAPGVRTTPRARARRVEPALVARAAGAREGQSSSGADSSAQPPPRAAPVKGRRRLRARPLSQTSDTTRERMERLPRGDDDETVQEPPVEAAPEPPPSPDDGMNLMMDMDGSDFFSSPEVTSETARPNPRSRFERPPVAPTSANANHRRPDPQTAPHRGHSGESRPERRDKGRTSSTNASTAVTIHRRRRRPRMRDTTSYSRGSRHHPNRFEGT